MLKDLEDDYDRTGLLDEEAEAGHVSLLELRAKLGTKVRVTLSKCVCTCVLIFSRRLISPPTVPREEIWLAVDG